MERAAGVRRSAVVPDARDQGRALRATWHHEAGLLVLSVWRGNVCVSTARLRPEDVPVLIEVLASGLAEAYPAVPAASPAAG
ncbi:hypothetical protein [uncultured Phycicoccus sp.]|uniref:hypothetical protein n=1 Tax=uncultured Phycicoccus sp. TaxID=661422 RepID=UPI0026019934|nr:hypothetical protein [uncultured Phycicoccus sp.]